MARGYPADVVLSLSGDERGDTPSARRDVVIPSSKRDEAQQKRAAVPEDDGPS